MLSSRKLVDSAEEHDVLERLLDESKPALPRAFELPGLHYLLSTPFRYPPLPYGSRFGTPAERGIWYGAEELETSFAEYAYYRLVLFRGSSADLLPNTITVTAFRAGVTTARGVDLTLPPFDAHRDRICSRTAYADSQRLGSEMRADGVEAFRYPSARCPRRAAAIGLFTPAAFASRSPMRPAQNWFCTVTARGEVEYRRQGVGAAQRVSFPPATFLVGGKLPHPAV